MNAYVRPLMGRYVAAIRAGLDSAGVDAPPVTIMQSSGGVMASADATVRPVLALESGPAAGVVAALGIARRRGLGNAIAFDMGGTTAKASLIEDGAVSRAREYEAGGSLSTGSRLMRGTGELLRIPSIDIAEVGAGGGSIAWLDPAGGLQVGPRSAGAVPGPACYGRGGEGATVTDANVFLGFIPPGPLASGDLSVSPDLAERALERIAGPLRRADDGCDGRSGRAHAIAQRADDPRAALGLLREGTRSARVRADRLRRGGARACRGARRGARLRDRGRACPRRPVQLARPALCEAGVPRRPPLPSRRAPGRARRARRDLRGARGAGSRRQLGEEASTGSGAPSSATGGQSWEVEIDVRPGPIAELIARFEDEHERLYGVRGEPGSPIEIRALRLAGIGPSPAGDSFRLAESRPDAEGSRLVRFDGVARETPVRPRASISASAEPGPVLVDEYDTTVVVRPGWTVRRDPATDTLVLERA